MKARTPKEILAPGSNFRTRFIPDHKELKQIVEQFKKMGYKVVLTQGVYDLIHEGHALYLESAKAQGDILVVGVDSDKLTRNRKGKNRPIVPEKERLNMLSHLRAVDIMTLRHDTGDINYLIKILKPDVYVASKTTSDITSKRLREIKANCKKLVLLPAQALTTTTNRIRNLTMDGVEELAKEVSLLTASFLDKIRQR